MPSPGAIEGYCVKCKTKRTINGGKPEKSKNGGIMHKGGACHKCGTGMCKMLPKNTKVA